MPRQCWDVSKSMRVVLFDNQSIPIEIVSLFALPTLYACTVQYLMGSSMKPQNCSTQPTQNTFLILKAQKD